MIITPRIYTNKPRTTGLEYKGMFSQPYLCLDWEKRNSGFLLLPKSFKTGA